MSVIYNGMHVDERYASGFEPNLFFDSWLIPGVTCTDKYQEGPAGGYYVHKLKKGNDIEPGTPGRDFSHETVADDLIQIMLNNNFQKSTKMYKVQADSVAAPLAEAKLADTVAQIKEAVQGSALAALYTEGKKGAIVAASADNAKDTMIDARTALVKARAGSARVILAHPDYYALILKAAGRDFTPVTNDRIVGNASVGQWLGFTIFECPQLGAGATYKYYDYAGTSKSVTATNFDKVNFIAMNPLAFSAIHNLEVYRLIDGGKDFTGSLAQAEVNSGFRVTNQDLVYISRNAE